MKKQKGWMVIKNGEHGYIYPTEVEAEVAAQEEREFILGYCVKGGWISQKSAEESAESVYVRRV